MNPIRSAAVLFTASSLFAQGIQLPPSDLAPGEPYRVLFVTTTVRDATSPNIADYNAFVTADANASPALAALNTNWRAIGSTTTINARDNTDTNPMPIGLTGVPIYLPDGTRLADNYDDLWDGTLFAQPNVDSLGNLYSGTVWTGTTLRGTPQINGTSFDLQLGTAACRAGNTAFSSAPWVGASVPPSFALLPFYGISEVLGAQPGPDDGSQTVRRGVVPNALAFVTGSTVPQIDATWQPMVDHSLFTQDALLDLVFFGATPIDVTLPGFGTVLIDQLFGSLSATPSIEPGTPFRRTHFAFVLGNDPALVGVSVNCQALTLDSSFALHLTNAIDIVVGTN